MWAPAAPLSITPAQRAILEHLARGRRTAHRLTMRAKIVLAAAEGQPNHRIAATLGVSRPTVLLWRARFEAHGVEGLRQDAPRPGRTPSVSAAQIKAVVDATLHTPPPNATHWSVRTMARAQGLSRMTVQRIWHAHQLKPHLVESFKLSRDPAFVEKLRDVVGLYLNPPDRALVFSVNEKSQIQALDRTQPGLPLKRGRAGTMTHDYKRNGTATLFAALNTLDGKVISLCQERHRHQEWLRFLRLVDDATPDHKQLHLIVDNYATHKHPVVQRWLKRHPRFQIHFTPTSASWLNMVERFFRDLTVNRLRRGVFRDVMELVTAIEAYVDHHNDHPKPFIWTASATDILEKVKRARKTLVNVQSV
jgi:transposase